MLVHSKIDRDSQDVLLSVFGPVLANSPGVWFADEETIEPLKKRLGEYCGDPSRLRLVKLKGMGDYKGVVNSMGMAGGLLSHLRLGDVVLIEVSQTAVERGLVDKLLHLMATCFLDDRELFVAQGPSPVVKAPVILGYTGSALAKEIHTKAKLIAAAGGILVAASDASAKVPRLFQRSGIAREHCRQFSLNLVLTSEYCGMKPGGGIDPDRHSPKLVGAMLLQGQERPERYAVVFGAKGEDFISKAG
ncbi:hypothetical protein [Ferrimonas marina]|nr:hypothetical protein [Ferrimonas marina]